MTRYLISFDDGAMTFPEEEMPDVAKAAHEVVQKAKDAGVWVFGGGLESQRASVVATDGTVTDGPYPETKEVGHRRQLGRRHRRRLDRQHRGRTGHGITPRGDVQTGPIPRSPPTRRGTRTDRPFPREIKSMRPQAAECSACLG